MRVVAVCLVLLSTVASADPAAEKLFQDGRTAMRDGKLPEACDAFRRSNEIEPRVGTLLNLGDCEEKRGRIATAWETFVQARALAAQQQDARAAEADKRAGTIAPKLPYLTLRTPATKPAGFAITRSGRPVPAAELDHEVPIDPGTYELEASAPGHLAWKQTMAIAIGQKAVVEVPALAPDPAAPATPPPSEPGVVGTVTPIDAVVPARVLTGKHRLGVGAAIGLSTDGDVIYGVRVPVRLAPVGNGAIRALPSLFYASFSDPGDVYHEIKLYAVGLGLEYLAPLAPTFYIAAGLGVGLDLIDDNYGEGVTRQTWGAARLSPTLRVGRALDIGLHLQLVATKDNVVGLGELGVDYFFW